MPTDIRLNRQFYEQDLGEALPTRREIRFEIVADNHAPMSEEAEATMARLREMAAAEAEASLNRQVAEQVFYQQYQNSWGNWSDALPPSRREERPVPSRRELETAAAAFSGRMNVQGTVSGRMSATTSARPAARTFDIDRAKRIMLEQGYDDWMIVLEVPGPFADPATIGVLECVRNHVGQEPERKYFLFHRRSAAVYQVTSIQSEAEYVTGLRRRNVNVTHFYQAQVDGRRRLVAKLLAGGREQYQLLLAPVVDDDALRASLTSPEYKEALCSHECRVDAASARMLAFKRQRRDATHVQALPEPESDRGRRAAQADERNQGRRRERAARPVDGDFTIP